MASKVNWSDVDAQYALIYDVLERRGLHLHLFVELVPVPRSPSTLRHVDLVLTVRDSRTGERRLARRYPVRDPRKLRSVSLAEALYYALVRFTIELEEQG